MKTRAIRLYGANELKLDTFEIGPVCEDEILAHVVCDSACMSTYKGVVLGTGHKRIPADIAENPVVMGHEFTGTIVEVGAKWQHQFTPGMRFAIQPNINSQGKGYAPGYSFPDFGGNSQYIRIPGEVMEKQALLPYTGDAFFKASLAEPLSCIIGAFKASFHYTDQAGEVVQGIQPGGTMVILGGTGPMGLCAIDYAMSAPVRPRRVVVTGTSPARFARAQKIFCGKKEAESGVEVVFVNTGECKTAVEAAERILAANQGAGFDDVMLFAAVPIVVETAPLVAGQGCCINFFAGPTDQKLSAPVNFYDIHYRGVHYVGTSGGSSLDMKEAVDMIGAGLADPSVMLTHVGGLDAGIEVLLDLPSIPGGKKMIYNDFDLPLTDITDFGGKPGFETLAELVAANDGLWSPAAEEELLRIMAK